MAPRIAPPESPGVSADVGWHRDRKPSTICRLINWIPQTIMTRTRQTLREARRRARVRWVAPALDTGDRWGSRWVAPRTARTRWVAPRTPRTRWVAPRTPGGWHQEPRTKNPREPVGGTGQRGSLLRYLLLCGCEQGLPAGSSLLRCRVRPEQVALLPGIETPGGGGLQLQFD